MPGRTHKSILAALLVVLALGVTQATVSRASDGMPVFSDPTQITNPFFPLSSTKHTISLGTQEGISVRNEVTSLPESRSIVWAGGQIEALVMQFVEYANGQLIEVAYDYYAQSDDGSVYYLGEDVTNYENGEIVNHEGSWLTGRDGAPPALIMPAHPTVGQEFNSENLPGVVYETDKVLSLTQETTTPDGPITDGLYIQETLMDGGIEYKVYASGFGIVEERAGNEQTNLVLLTSAETAPGVVPDALQTIEAQAEDIIDYAPDGNWSQIAADVDAIAEAWDAYQPLISKDNVPLAFQDALTVALTHLKEASAAHNTTNTLQSANEVSAAINDLFTVYNPSTPVDLGWLDVLERQTVFDASANDLSATADDIAKANAVWVRLRPSILAHNGTDAALEFEANLYNQRSALVAKNYASIIEQATSALEIVDTLEQLY